ncbi:hypothetical protein [Staphylococcus casei]|uniref:Phage protein n=1 Tax=Staphylococcus casei TaxID=201828 RepID=A0ABZ2WEK2_9STAP
MIKATQSNMVNDKYEVQSVDKHYLKRLEKQSNQVFYFCIEQSEILSFEHLTTFLKTSKETKAIIGEENTRATLTDAGNGYYQVTFIYFEKSFSALKEATTQLTLLEEQEARNYMLAY